MGTLRVWRPSFPRRPDSGENGASPRSAPLEETEHQPHVLPPLGAFQILVTIPRAGSAAPPGRWGPRECVWTLSPPEEGTRCARARVRAQFPWPLSTSGPPRRSLEPTADLRGNYPLS